MKQGEIKLEEKKPRKNWLDQRLKSEATLHWQQSVVLKSFYNDNGLGIGGVSGRETSALFGMNAPSPMLTSLSTPKSSKKCFYILLGGMC